MAKEFKGVPTPRLDKVLERFAKLNVILSAILAELSLNAGHSEADDKVRGDVLSHAMAEVMSAVFDEHDAKEIMSRLNDKIIIERSDMRGMMKEAINTLNNPN